MAQVCELTGKKAMGGNNVSHAMNKTKRKFKVNLTTKRFYIPEEDRCVYQPMQSKPSIKKEFPQYSKKQKNKDL